MGNIWEALYQTLSVSLVAAVLLAVKALLRDKLSPRWQYAVWGVLALRTLLPASAERGIIPPLSLWLETWKSAIELHLSSAYTSAFERIDMGSVIPWPDAAPVSMTDWLFVIYAAGVAAALIRYAVNYARLRALLRRGSAAGKDTRAAIEAVAEKYKLRPCRAVTVPGLKSAFICGVFRPVLAVPEGEAPDGKIILHELLHLKYLDALQNVFWCILRALHWCNPFMHYVFDRVGNDMESLCDQRVLERLAGEERREYGGILLGMANAAYARAPGTSSISNGAKNIARRIEAIARFKLYPRGMALVSVCAALVLCSALLTGAGADTSGYISGGHDALATLAAARVARCESISGALDVYAHGVIEDNAACLASVAPLGEQERYYELLVSGESPTDARIREQIDEMREYREPYSVTVYNLREDGSGGYLATLDISGEWVEMPTANILPRHVLIPVALEYDEGWTVTQCGAEQVIDRVDITFNDAFREYIAFGEAECAGGRVEAGVYTEYNILSYVPGQPNRYNSFDRYMVNSDIRYYRDSWTFGGPLARTVSVQYQILDEYDPGYDLDELRSAVPGGNYSSSDGSGQTTARIESLEPGWIQAWSGGGGSVDNYPAPLPGGLAVCVFADDEPVDAVVIELEAVE